MHAYHAQPVSPSSMIRRSGVTASAVALVLAGFTVPAAAQDAGDATPPAPSPEGTDAAPDGAAPPDDAEPAEQLYEVVPGDSLSAIAGAHGLDPVQGWRLLFAANPEIADPDLIVPGQVLRIPAPDEDLDPRPIPAPAPAPVPEGTAQATPAPQQATPAPAHAPTTEPQANTSAPAGVWDRLAQCESGGNWHANTGNGYYGGLQFSPSSWAAVGGAGYPHEASREEQIQRGQQLQAIQGWGAWPSCSRQLGLR